MFFGCLVSGEKTGINEMKFKLVSNLTPFAAVIPSLSLREAR